MNFKRNWLQYLGGVAVLLIILYEARVKGDFDLFLSASADMFEGKNIYAIKYREWYHYYYSTLFATILFPLTFLPLYAAKVCWLLINVFFVYRIWKVIIYHLPTFNANKKYNLLLALLTFLFMLRFLRDNFHLAQMTVFILFLILEGLFLIDNNKPILGAVLIALGIDIKLLPLVVVPYLFYRNEWKAGIFVMCFTVFFLIVPGAFIGFEFNNFLLAERWNLLNPTDREHILDVGERSFHSLSTLLATLLVEGAGDHHTLPIKRNIANITVEQLEIIINLVRGILVLATLYFLRSVPFTKTNSKIQKLYERGYILLLVPLIFPHQQHYSFLFIFPAVAYLIYYLLSMYRESNLHSNNNRRRNNWRISLTLLLLIVYFLTNSHFILGEFRHIYDHFKTLTYGALLLLILLAACPPKRLSALES